MNLTPTPVKQVLDGLREHFELCRAACAGTPGMPSQVVDVACHEFILHPREHQRFCRRALGRHLRHTPAEAMRAPTQGSDALRCTWTLACRRAGSDPRRPTRLPELFAIDASRGIPDGFHYLPDRMAAATVVPPGRRPVYCGSQPACTGAVGGGGDASPGRHGETAMGDTGGRGVGGGCGGSWMPLHAAAVGSAQPQ